MKNCCENLRPYVSLSLRAGLGIIFVYHGVGKVFGFGNQWGMAWNSHGMSVIIQLLVSWGELLGGIALLIGFMTCIAATGLGVIMLGAIFTVHGKNGFGIMDGGYEYNFALIIMCLALISSGPGRLSVDSKWCCK